MTSGCTLPMGLTSAETVSRSFFYSTSYHMPVKGLPGALQRLLKGDLLLYHIFGNEATHFRFDQCLQRSLDSLRKALHNLNLQRTLRRVQTRRVACIRQASQAVVS
eukprot:RCo039162